METITEEKQTKSAWLFWRCRLRFEVFRRDGFQCVYCGRTVADGVILTLEHIVPKSQGGDYSKDNLACACDECNTGKADYVLSKWELWDLKRVWRSMRPLRSPRLRKYHLLKGLHLKKHSYARLTFGV